MNAAPLQADIEYLLAHIIRDFMQFMHDSGLSAPQIHTLLYIYHAGECRLSDIQDLSDSSKPAASQLVERLVQQGLVERTEDPADRRNKKLRLTETSLALMGRGVAANGFLQTLMKELTAEQRKVVQTALTYLARAAMHVQPLHHRKESRHA